MPRSTHSPKIRTWKRIENAQNYARKLATNSDLTGIRFYPVPTYNFLWAVACELPPLRSEPAGRAEPQRRALVRR